jgi:hypothetical protein
MEFKNAAAVCLISLFSATLVVLIVRSLDSQAASRLEPKLSSIIEELRMLRGQGGIASAPDDSIKAGADGNALIVYYFHSNARCPTCRSIESQTKEIVQTHFSSQLGNGEVVWKILNYEQPEAKPLATKFEIIVPVVVLAKMKDGQVQDWTRLDEVWALVDDKPAFTKYVQGEIERMLAYEKQPMPIKQEGGSNLPIPKSESTSENKPPAIPIPQ